MICVHGHEGRIWDGISRSASKKPGIPGEAGPGRHSADRPGNVPPEYQIRHGAKAGTRVCGSALSSDLLYTGNFRAGTA